MRLSLAIALTTFCVACAPEQEMLDTGSSTGTGSTSADSGEGGEGGEAGTEAGTEGGMADAGESGAEEGGEEGGLVMNGCGTFDPTIPGDGVIPQDPDDEDIIAACQAFCSDCDVDCLESCKQRSCDVCPGTLAPYVQCLTDNAAQCVCADDNPDCAIPAPCEELSSMLGWCGG